jgi:ParB/RepB/Spo0J family partition protein
VPVSAKPKKGASGAMASIVAQGQENVARLEESFGGPIVELATDYLRPSATNPRRRISAASIAEMVNGIRQVDGEILQPLLVRPVPPDDAGTRYETVCGNRRLLAARSLGLPKVPVRVREMNDDQAARFALWENLAREDLDPVDLAESIDGLRRIEKLSWEEISDRFGFSRQWGWKQQKIAELPDAVKDMVRDRRLSPSKAMLLAQATTDPSEITQMAGRAVTRGLSHRALSTEIAEARKHVLTSGADGAQDGTLRKHVLTWTAPCRPRRGTAPVMRAAEQMVQGLNSGVIDRDFARALQPIAQRIIEIAADLDDASQSREGSPLPKRQHESEKIPVA